jgi:hypothetical protein
MLRVYKQLKKKSSDNNDNDDDDELNISKQLLGFLSFLWKIKGFLIIQTWSLILPVIFFVVYVAYTGCSYTSLLLLSLLYQLLYWNRGKSY